MSPVSHFLISWSVASCFKISRKDRILVTIAGVIPDIDGLGLAYDLLPKAGGPSLQLWSTYHHVLCHNLGFGLLVTAAAFLAAGRRLATAGLVLLSFHLHLFCDLIGSRGPDGYQWPIPYLLPFSHRWQWAWAGQWPLDAWPNFVITAAVICFIGYQACRGGISPLEIFSSRASRAFAETLQKRFRTSSQT